MKYRNSECISKRYQAIFNGLDPNELSFIAVKLKIRLSKSDQTGSCNHKARKSNLWQLSRSLARTFIGLECAYDRSEGENHAKRNEIESVRTFLN